MKITDRSFTNSDREYHLVRAFLSEVAARPDLDDNWDAGRMDLALQPSRRKTGGFLSG